MLIENFGIEGDAHAGKWHRQVSFLALESINKMRERAGKLVIKNGDFGENIITRGIDWSKVQVGGMISISDTLLEVTQIGKECHSGCAIYDAVGVRLEGPPFSAEKVYLAMLDNGTVK